MRRQTANRLIKLIQPEEAAWAAVALGTKKGRFGSDPYQITEPGPVHKKA